MTSRAGARRAPWIGLVLGVVLLAVLFVFAVLLPRAAGGSHGGSVAALPDTLPGGWTALETLDPPEGAGDDFAEQQQSAVDFVGQALDDVYDEDTAFRAYTTEDFSSFVTVTVFAAPGGAFGPPNGVADPETLQLDKAPVELVREGDAVCVVNNQTGQPGQPSDPAALPLGVSCQLSEGGQTFQIGSQQLSVDETVELLEAVAAG